MALRFLPWKTRKVLPVGPLTGSAGPANPRRTETISKRPAWWRPFARRRQRKVSFNSGEALFAAQQISNLTAQRDSMIEQIVNARKTTHGNPTTANYEMTLRAARGLALHDPRIAAVQKEINQKIAELDQRINVRKTAYLMLKQRVREIPAEIRELEADKKRWEQQFATSTEAMRKQGQGMLLTVEKQLAEKRHELKIASRRAGLTISFPTALEIVTGSAYESSQLGFSGGGQYHGLTQFGATKYPDLGLRKKQRK